MDPLIYLVIGVATIVVAVFVVLQIVGRLLRKVGPNQALIVYGAGGTRVITGGSHFVIPLYQRAQEFSLELMSFDVAPAQDLYTSQGVAVNVEAVTQIKVRSDEESVKTAAEQFLSKRQEDRENLIRLVMEGHLRGIVGQLTVEELVKDPENVGAKMLKTVTPDMEKMGLEVISFTIKDVRDKNEYISNMGRPQIAQIRKQADIAAALAQRDTQIQQANASREAAVAKSAADQERVKAEAELIRARGLAEAEVIRAKGEAEADAMKVKAAAFHEYNQAAVLDKLLTGMPEMVRAIAEPLSKVDKVTIVSTGGDNSHGLGASRITGDVMSMVAQVPALFELLSGTRIGDLMNRVPALANQDGNPGNAKETTTRVNGTGSPVDPVSDEK